MDDLGALGSSAKACLQKPAPSGCPRPGPTRERLCDLLNLQTKSAKHGRQAPLALAPPGKNELHRRLSVPGRRRRCCRSATPRMQSKKLLPAGERSSVFVTNVND